MVTQEQIAFFARNGFLHVPGLIAAETCDAMVELTWERLPPHWSRTDPGTWKGLVQDTCHVGDINQARGHLRFQRGNLLNARVVEDAFGTGGPGCRLAQDLIGHPLQPMRLRGFYVIVPLERADDINPVTNPHIEAHAVQLISMCYLDDVQPGGGGLSVWPGSHRDIYPLMGSKMEHVGTPEHVEMLRRYRRFAPIEIHGAKGDIVIIHHRLLHAPSLNRSNRLRLGFLCDYECAHGMKLRSEKPGEMWEDWPSVSALPKAMIEGPSDYSLKLIADGERLPQHRFQHLPVSTKRGAAAILARMRQPGDVWLTISDSPEIVTTPRLDPEGSNIISAGVSVMLNGKKVESQSIYDIVARVDLKEGENRVEIVGADRELWVKLLRLELPFENNRILYTCKVSTGMALSTSMANCFPVPGCHRFPAIQLMGKRRSIVGPGQLNW